MKISFPITLGTAAGTIALAIAAIFSIPGSGSLHRAETLLASCEPTPTESPRKPKPKPSPSPSLTDLT